MPGSLADILAGNAYVNLDLKMVGTWGKKMSQMSHRLRSAAMQLGTSAIIMASPFLAGTKVFADFSKQMAFVATMLDKPQEHMAAFTAGIRKLSVEFGESTTTLTRGLYDILSAGFAPAQALQMLAVTTTAAKAGMADASSATAAIIAVLNAYGLSAEHAANVSDVLFTTVRYGVLTFGELAGHIGLVASTAAQAGVSMEDMGAVLAIITRGGVETSHAVVALNNILKAFLMPTGAGADFAAKLKEAGLGFELSADYLKEVGLVGAFKQIAQLSTAKLARLFSTIRATRGVFAMKAGWQGLLEVVEKFKDTGGATARAMNEIKKSFGFLIDRVKQAGALILSHIGEALAGNLKNVGEKVINIATGFGKWIKQNKELILLTAKMIVGLGGLAVAILIVAKAMAMLSAIMALAAGPAGWIKLAAALAATLAIWKAMGMAIEKVKREMQEIQNMGAKQNKAETKTKKPIGSLLLFHLEQELAEQKRKIALEAGAIKRAKGDLAEANRKWARQAPGIWIFGGPGYSPVAKSLQRDIRLATEAIYEYEQKLKAAIKKGRDVSYFIEAEKKRLALMEKQTATIEKQVKMIERIAGMGRQGYFLGYQHTPVLAWAADGVGKTEEVDLLSDIQLNTKATADTIAEAIGKGPTAE